MSSGLQLSSFELSSGSRFSSFTALILLAYYFLDQIYFQDLCLILPILPSFCRFCRFLPILPIFAYICLVCLILRICIISLIFLICNIVSFFSLFIFSFCSVFSAFAENLSIWSHLGLIFQSCFNFVLRFHGMSVRSSLYQ